VNGITYDEANPTGIDTLPGSNGCDSVVTITLNFVATTGGSETYVGCIGDGYSVVVNGTTYDETNPTGSETLTGGGGCDSVVTIDLVYNAPTTGTETYIGCMGDGYSVVVNGTTYDETNPTGIDTLTGSNGCDSIVTIDLIFNPLPTGSETYTGCMGDGYSVIVNGTTYDETNPTGTETITGGSCDSLVTIDLQFNPATAGVETYTGCIILQQQELKHIRAV
jgi:hypothetical protein